jgi:hypothetical protein
MTADDDGSSPKDRAAALVAKLDAAKARAHDAHVDARDELALVGTLLLALKENPDGAQRLASARLLLRLAASWVGRGLPLPVPLREWLSQGLYRAAQSGSADAALGLRIGRGNRADTQRHMRNVGQIYALMHWHEIRLEPAASAALPTAYGETGEPGSGEDTSVLVKQYRAINKKWIMKGPFLAHTDGYPLGETAATLADLKQGRNVSVVFERRGVPGVSIGMLLPRQLADAT